MLTFPYWPHRTQLLIIDEAARLKTAGLEQVRDYDFGDRQQRDIRFVYHPMRKDAAIWVGLGRVIDYGR